MENEQLLQDLANEFLAARDAETEAKARKDKLREKIKSALSEVGLMKEGVTVGTGERVYFQEKEKISFDAALMAFLKSNGYDTYVIEKVDDAAVKKAIEKGGVFATQIEPYTVRNHEQAICVEGGKKKNESN